MSRFHTIRRRLDRRAHRTVNLLFVVNKIFLLSLSLFRRSLSRDRSRHRCKNCQESEHRRVILSRKRRIIFASARPSGASGRKNFCNKRLRRHTSRRCFRRKNVNVSRHRRYEVDRKRCIIFARVLPSSGETVFWKKPSVTPHRVGAAIKKTSRNGS